MSFQHHGEGEQSDAMRRFIEEVAGRAKREFPDGRIGAEDDGVASYAIAADPHHGIVRIVFTKPMNWIGLDIESATALRDKLTEKIFELRGITV